jgi:hypothetical protein
MPYRKQVDRWSSGMPIEWESFLCKSDSASDDDSCIDPEEAIESGISRAQLGEDEIVIILNYLYQAVHHDLSLIRKQFTQYSLVSRKWRHYAQTLLFRRIEPSGSLLSRIIKDITHPTYLSALLIRVRILSLSDSQLLSGRRDTQNSSSYRQLGSSMSLFPLLYELRLIWRSAAPTQDDVKALACTPRIVALRLTVIDPLVTVILPLVQAWPLRHLFLTIKLMSPSTVAELQNLASSAPTLRLEEVGIDVPRFGPTHPVVEWILRCTSRTLRVLHLDGARSLLLLTPHPLLSQLYSLSLTNYNLLDSIKDMTSLVELTLLIDEQVWESGPIRRCFQQLPVSLQYLRIMFCPSKEYYWEEDTRRFLQFIKAQVAWGGRPWRLKRVTFQGPRNSHGGALADCRRQYCALGTQLVFEQDSPKVCFSMYHGRRTHAFGVVPRRCSVLWIST